MSRGVNPLTGLWPHEAADKEAHNRRRREAEQDASEWQALKAEVKADWEAKDRANAAPQAELAGMTPQQIVERTLRSRRDAVPGDYEKRPPRWVMAENEIRLEEREAEQAERQAREQALGIPEAQRDWMAAKDAAHEQLAAAELEIRAASEADLQAARDKERQIVEALGQYPELESITAA